MPPGINMVDTSLALVGRAYPNYGEKIAENFLHLLENFASPTNPQHPILGQLWYDTSSNTLRVNNGAGWPSANGIYQQTVDPQLNNSVGLKNGDIWVDTTLNELKIYSAGSWTLVGPATTSTAASQTGPEIAIVTGIDQVERRIIKNWANGSVITVISADSFTPNPVIDGFSTLVPGVNLSSNSFNSTQPIFNGTAVAAQSLTVGGLNYPASNFLKKDDQTSAGQVITGKVTFKSPADQTNAQGRDGILVSYKNNYIQLYKSNKDAVLLNNEVGGKLKFVVQTGQVAGINALKEVMVIQNQAVRIDSDLYVSGSVYPNSSQTFGAVSYTHLTLPTNREV